MLLSFLFAVAVVSLLNPLFITLVGQNIDFALEPMHLIFIAATFVFTTLICGIYPALQLSGVAAIHVWRSKRFKNKMMRTLLVVQNSISIALIICTLVIARQLQFIQNKDLGFSKNQIAYVVLRGKITNHIDVRGTAQRIPTPRIQPEMAMNSRTPVAATNNRM